MAHGTTRSRQDTGAGHQDEIRELKSRIELTELRARDVEAQARLLDGQMRLAESRAKFKASRAVPENRTIPSEE